MSDGAVRELGELGGLVSDGVPFGEGPVWCPDGTLVCASVSHGALYRVWPDSGRAVAFAVTGGGANAAAPCADGSFLVTQNGGIDLAAVGHDVRQPPVEWRDPGIQRAWPDGRVVPITDEVMQAPNDLTVAADGTVYFTDPGPYPPSGQIARVMAMATDGSTSVVVEGFAYANGIAVDTDGAALLVVVDDRQVVRVDPRRPEGHETVIADVGESGGDGLCLDTDGRVYVAMRRANGVAVFEPDASGEYRESTFLAIAGPGAVTNCCFGGHDSATLFATEARGGRVFSWPNRPAPGLPVHQWAA